MITQSKLIKQMSELFIIQRGHYLIQYKEPIGYRQYTAGQLVNGKKVKALMDWQFEKHIQGEFTVGTFGGKVMTKFMSFDVDFHDPQKAKWITYKLSDALKELGIKNHYISYSGNKGYHVDLFFDDLIQIEHAEKFYNLVVNKSDVLQHSDTGNKVEFRPSDKMGIKLPLGIHQLSGNYCGFCLVEDGLKVMDKDESEEYLFTIKKMKSEIIQDIIGIENKEVYDKKTYVKTEDAISSHVPLANYEQSEDYSIDLAIDLLQNGLKFQGSRHKSTLLIGMYLKYSGLDFEECKSELYTWMEWQNPSTYTTKLDDCHNDIDQVVKDIYERNYNLRSNTKNMTVSLDEINWIIEKCPEKNQKLITYAMLIHSKRHATLQGVFFMPFKDITQATGIYDQAVQQQVNKLIGLDVVEVIERNRKPKGQGLKRKLPNLYRLKLTSNLDEQNIETKEVLFTTEYTNNFESCMRFYFTDKELKKMLPRRQYESLIG
jgi:hypothetical protein